MFGGLLARLHAGLARIRRVERRELREFRWWLEDTQNLLHLSLLVVMPAIFAGVTMLSNTVDVLPFLLFPPLASGSYTLFAHPESRYASPRRFVGGLTAGGLCGWLALKVTSQYVYQVPQGSEVVHPGAAALGLFLTGVVTWGLDMEEASAYSTALLIHVTGASQFTYVLSIAVSTVIVAGVFVVWRSEFYEERADFLYRTTGADDHVLVPMRRNGGSSERTASFGATVASAHESGKVVLLDVVDDEAAARAERALIEEEGQEGELVGATDGGESLDGDPDQPAEPSIREEAEQRAVAERAMELEELADEIEAEYDVPCEVVVAVAGDGWSKGVVADTVREVGCDLVVAPYETEDDKLSKFASDLFRLDTDVITLRSKRIPERWDRVMVAVSEESENAQAMVDFARRVTGNSFAEGTVSVCHCIDSERQRRRAERMLADLVDAFAGEFETRVARTSIQTFLEANASGYDLVILGASTDRSTASRFVVPPTFTRLDDVDTDIAVVHRAR